MAFTKYEANDLPENATPAWTVTPGDTWEIAAPDLLHVITTSSADMSLEVPMSDSTGSTIEIGMNSATLDTLANATTFLVFTLTDSYGWIDLEIYSNKVGLRNALDTSIYFDFDATQAHTIRVTLKNNNANLYVDGVFKGTLGLNDDYTVEGLIVSFAGTEELPHESYTDYIYWDTTGAYVPRTVVSGARTAITGTALDQQQTGNVNNSYFGFPADQEQIAQSFQPSLTADISRFTYKLRKIGSPTDSVQVAIYSDSSSSPGTQLSVSTNSVLGSSITEDYVDYDFDFATGTGLTVDTSYWAVLRRTGATDSSNYYRFARGANDSVYTRGTYKKTNDGSTWTTASQDTYFKEYYNPGRTAASSRTAIPSRTVVT